VCTSLFVIIMSCFKYSSKYDIIALKMLDCLYDDITKFIFKKILLLKINYTSIKLLYRLNHKFSLIDFNLRIASSIFSKLIFLNNLRSMFHHSKFKSCDIVSSLNLYLIIFAGTPPTIA